jgi:DNA-directed RNA polymerase specialized sigma24 family protein
MPPNSEVSDSPETDHIATVKSLFERLRPRGVRAATLIVRNKRDAEGVVDEALARLLSSQAPRGAALEAWFLGCVHTAARETIYTRKRLRLRLVAILHVLIAGRESMQREMDHLIKAMTPAAAVPLPPQVLQAQRNASARHLLVTEFGGLTSADIGELAGSKASNRAALAHRWKSDGRIFAVTHQGTPTFPGFQFSPEGQPLPVIAELLAILGASHSGWELALWFIGSNGWLARRRPVDLLLTEPDRVIAAAKHEAEALVF